MAERSTQREVALASIIEASRFEGSRIPDSAWEAIVNGVWELRHGLSSGRGASQALIAELLDTVSRESLDA